MGEESKVVKRTVDFIFDMDEIVITPFNEQGIISMLGFDDGGNHYYVKGNTSANWYKEKQLRKKW